LFSGCTNWPRLEKGKGKKRAAGVPAASLATAVDLGVGEGRCAPGQASQEKPLRGGRVRHGRARGRPRANSHYMELDKGDMARRETSCVLRRNTDTPCVRGLYL
jgi:hypothetical protein